MMQSMQTAAGYRLPLGEYFPLLLAPPPLVDLLSDPGSPVYLSRRPSLQHIAGLESHVPPAERLRLQMSALQGSNYFSLT